jgi:hypothetical protein
VTGDDTQDPRDVTDQLGLQDARDDSDPGPTLADLDDELYHGWGWRDRYDTREEWEESR